MGIIEKTVYIVNGKTFENKTDALIEEYKFTARKYIEILDLVNNAAYVMESNKSLCNLVISVNDEELMPGYYQTKPFYKAFITLLKDRNIPFSSYDGGERNSAEFKIYPCKIEYLPKESEALQYIVNYFEQCADDSL